MGFLAEQNSRVAHFGGRALAPLGLGSQGSRRAPETRAARGEPGTATAGRTRGGEQAGRASRRVRPQACPGLSGDKVTQSRGRHATRAENQPSLNTGHAGRRLPHAESPPHGAPRSLPEPQSAALYRAARRLPAVPPDPVPGTFLAPDPPGAQAGDGAEGSRTALRPGLHSDRPGSDSLQQRLLAPPSSHPPSLPRARARPLHAARRKGPALHGQSVLPPGLRSPQQTQPACCSSRPSSSWPAQGGLRLTPLSRCHLHQEARPPILHQPAVSTGDPRAPPGGGPILQRHPVSPLPTQRPVPRWQLPGP